MPASGRFAHASGLRYGWVFLLGMFPIAAAAQNPAPDSSKAPHQPIVYSAPLELIHDKPYVSVLVNGRGPYRFLIDTGTGAQALVSPALAEELHLPPAGHARLSDPSRLGEQRSEIVRIESLNLAGAEFSETDAIVHNLYGDANCQGVLGFPFFEDYLLTLDFPNRRMMLTTGAVMADAAGSVLPFSMPDGVPVVALDIEGHQIEAQIDSGGTGLSVPEKQCRELKFQDTPTAFALGESVSTRFEIKAARLQSDVKLGRYTFKDAFVEINAAFPIANIGPTPLQHFTVTFDQTHERVRLYSSEETLHLDASPALIQLLNEPRQATDSKLVPVGF